ncbi:MAG: sigma-70 family RNA polymerase sigma factor [Candidatus Hydrogenedentes bacterium]|nr:sigma-70 family RNA polymerase sigma factor [Candidatus Hydrogenedentota bacterium]
MTHFTYNDDAAVVRSALSGNRDEFGRLVERYLPMVHALVRANLGAWGDIDDIAQDTFLAAFNSLDKLREPEKFAGWLATITRNECIRHAKDKKRFDRNVIAWSEGSPSVTSEDPGLRELHVMLEQAVRDLDVQHREILLLYYFSKKDMNEIEAVLDITRETAKKRLQRARAALETHITFKVGDLLEGYAPRREQAVRVVSAIALAQPMWLLGGNATAAASSLTTWGTLIMKSKTVVFCAVAGLVGLGVVGYSYAGRESEGAIKAHPGAQPPVNPVTATPHPPASSTASNMLPQNEDVVEAAREKTSIEPARSRIAQSTHSGMPGGNPQRTGFFDVPAPLTMPALRWEAEFNGLPGTMPAIDTHGRVFVSHGEDAFTNLNGPDWLSAFDPKGRMLWEYGPVNAPRSTGSAAILPDGKVLFAFADRTTHAFDPQTGSIAWSAGFSNREMLIDSHGNFYTSSRAGLEKADGSSGVALWDPIPNVSTPATLSIDERTLYARGKGSDDNLVVKFSLQAINAENGTPLWNFRPEESEDFLENWATPVIGRDGTVYVQDSGTGMLYAIRDNVDSAEQLWAYSPVSASLFQPTGTIEKEISMFNPSSDSPRLIATDGEAVYMGAFGYPVGILARPASVHAVGINGETLWHTALEEDVVTGSPVVTNDAVYILGGGDDNAPGANALYCLDRDNGQILWQMNVSPPHSDVGESIALAPDGTIYVATTGPNGEGSILRALR